MEHCCASAGRPGGGLRRRVVRGSFAVNEDPAGPWRPAFGAGRSGPRGREHDARETRRRPGEAPEAGGRTLRDRWNRFTGRM